MFPGILRLEDFKLGNIKFKNEDEITIKLKDLKVLLERNSNAFKELEEILFAMEMEKRATEVEKGNYELHSLEEMKSLLVEMKKNG